MIPKEERDVDKAICDAASSDWHQGHHVGEPRAICAASDMGMSLLGLDKDGMAIFMSEKDAAAAVTGRNRLLSYINALDELDSRIESLLECARKHESGEIRIDSEGLLPPEVSETLDKTAAAVLRLAVKLLRGT